MPAQSVDPGIDDEREHEAVEGAAHDHAGEECEDELHLAHRDPAGVTARAYPGSQQAGVPGSRCGSDQRAVMPLSVRAAGLDAYSVDWAMPSGSGRREARIHSSCEPVRSDHGRITRGDT